MKYLQLVIIFFNAFCKAAFITGISTLQNQLNEFGMGGSCRGGTSLDVHGDFNNGDPSSYSVLMGGLTCGMVHLNSD